MHANSRNGRDTRLPDASAAPQAPAGQLSAAFRTALGAASQKPHLDLPGAAGKRAAAMGKAERNDRSATKAVAPKATVPRSGHR